MRHVPAVVGAKFGALTVIADLGMQPRGRRRHHFVEVWCDCGTVFTVVHNAVKSGHTSACGPHHNRGIRHGLSKLPEYQIWRAMRERILCPAHPDFANYGGRGIRIDARWNDFRTFLADLGRRPSSAFTIERLDNDGHYEPGNVAWASRVAQNRNKRSNTWLEYKGERMILQDWAKRYKLNTPTLLHRLKIGWSMEQALTTRSKKAPKS